MNRTWSYAHKKPCVMVDLQTDIAEDVIAFCEKKDAVFEEEGLPRRFILIMATGSEPELVTEQMLREAFKRGW
jgi:hypothetical protein